MFAGFDYGTSNCAVGVTKQNTEGRTVELLPLEGESQFIPSALYCPARELITEFVGLNIQDQTRREDYIKLRSGALEQARRARREAHIDDTQRIIYVGNEAFEQYFDLPGEGYFVKSPKSFLGASGLRPEYVFFFEDIVSAMMQNIKQRAEQSLGHGLRHAVIGRPVNFQGLNSAESNRQAIDILTTSAKRAGFLSVEFLYEPLAAGLDFEANLTADKTVLVVDVGGGTTDCAMVRMGPGHRSREDRSQDFLGHSGERIGGNDLDILLAGKQLMPLFGMESTLKNGLPIPTKVYWDAVSTNDVSAQANFNHHKTTLHLEQLLRDASDPVFIERFINLRNERQNHHLVRSAEQCKVALLNNATSYVDLSYVEAGLGCEVSREQLSESIRRPLQKMASLMDEAITQAGCPPDLVYLTGGSGKSRDIRRAITDKLGAVDVLDGNHFGSVTAGLTLWAEKLFS